MNSNGLSSEQREGLTPIPQKMFNVSTKETLRAIKKFKNLEVTQQNSQQRLVEQDSVSLDSSIYLVEAALNYDFDFVNQNEEIAYETAPGQTSEYTIPITKVNMKVGSDDLEGVYIELSNYIESIINDSVKVKIIDLESYLMENNTVTYRATVITFWHPRDFNCSPIASSGRMWVLPGCNDTDPSASAILQNHVNLCIFSLCPESLNFYSQVTNVFFFNNTGQNSSSLFYGWATGPCPILTLSAADLNNRAAAIVTLGNANKPTPLHKPTSIVIIPWGMTQASQSVYWYHWSATMYYGVPFSTNC
jgi:hypothetical protein